MRSQNILPMLTAVGLSLLGSVFANEMLTRPCPHCACAEGCRYEEVVTNVCKMVEVKTPIKKTVYECKQVPYCKHALPKLGEGCCCKECEACARYKTVLIKKEITCGEKCETKCVVEEVKRIVPVPCHRCGHCGNGTPDTVVPPVVPNG